MSFSAMKARMSRTDVTKEIVDKVKTSYPVDERYWTPTADKQGNAKAVIRFLPAPEGEAEDFVKYFTHYFEGPGGRKYIERCRTSINEKDPAQEFASRQSAQATTEQAKKEIYGRYGRKPRYIANILVINDPGDTENNGKVFLFEFGQKIMNKITKAMEGSDDPIDPKEGINVLCPWQGANFKIVLTKKAGFNNYDDSEFMAPTVLFEGNEKKIEAIWKTAHKRQPEVSLEKIKSFEELSKILVGVVGDLAEVPATESRSASGAKNGTATSARAAKAGSAETPATTEDDDVDPNKVFDDLVKGTESMSADDAVDAMFAETEA